MDLSSTLSLRAKSQSKKHQAGLLVLMGLGYLIFVKVICIYIYIYVYKFVFSTVSCCEPECLPRNLHTPTQTDGTRRNLLCQTDRRRHRLTFSCNKKHTLTQELNGCEVHTRIGHCTGRTSDPSPTIETTRPRTRATHGLAERIRAITKRTEAEARKRREERERSLGPKLAKNVGQHFAGSNALFETLLPYVRCTSSGAFPDLVTCHEGGVYTQRPTCHHAAMPYMPARPQQ